MNRDHLIPAIVMDLIEKLSDNSVRENEKMNYQLRLEAIRDYCNLALDKCYNKNYRRESRGKQAAR